MNTHVKISQSEPADLSRRSFLVGTAAAGLALGYSAVPGLLGADQAFAATGNFDPSVWYSIAPDGIVTVTCGKADMGQHIASTMAQIISEELGSNWKDMRIQLASNDPKFNDPVLGAQITGGSWSTMMNYDAMSRAGAAGRMALTEAAAASMGVPAGELVVRDSVISHPKSKKSMTFADIVKGGKAMAHRFAKSCVRSPSEKEAYWRDVGTVDAYWEANLDLCEAVPSLDLYENEWPIWTYSEVTPPAKFVHDLEGRRGSAIASLVSGGCIVSGGIIRRTMLFTGCRVNSYSSLEDAVVLPNVSIGRNAKLYKVVIDRGVKIPEGLIVGEDPDQDAKRFRRTEKGVCLITQPMIDKLG